MGQRHDVQAPSEDDNFVRLAPVFNVRGLDAERAFYESLELRVSYEGDEYPDFIPFAAGNLEFGIQRAAAPNDPPSVLTWQLLVRDVDAILERCRRARLPHEVEQNDPAPGWRYRRVILETPSGYRLALEGMNEPSGGDVRRFWYKLLVAGTDHVAGRVDHPRRRLPRSTPRRVSSLPQV